MQRCASSLSSPVISEGLSIKFGGVAFVRIQYMYVDLMFSTCQSSQLLLCDVSDKAYGVEHM